MSSLPGMDELKTALKGVTSYAIETRVFTPEKLLQDGHRLSKTTVLTHENVAIIKAIDYLQNQMSLMPVRCLEKSRLKRSLDRSQGHK